MNNHQKKLLELARNAAENAYAVYSGLHVGAAVLSTSGQFYSGCNVENVSFPVGTCAEESAIAAMICGGDTRIAAILIYAESRNLISPCGACRQRIAEFSTPETSVYLANQNGIQKTLTSQELLPCCFSEF